MQRGGKLVAYAAPVGLSSIAKDAWKLAKINFLSKGKSSEFYGITALYLRDKKPFMEDLPLLLNMLAEGKIKPVIRAKLSP